MNRVLRVVRIDVLYVKDPRVATERSERLHGLEVQSECGLEKIE